MGFETCGTILQSDAHNLNDEGANLLELDQIALGDQYDSVFGAKYPRNNNVNFQYIGCNFL